MAVSHFGERSLVAVKEQCAGSEACYTQRGRRGQLRRFRSAHIDYGFSRKCRVIEQRIKHIQIMQRSFFRQHVKYRGDEKNYLNRNLPYFPGVLYHNSQRGENKGSAHYEYEKIGEYKRIKNQPCRRHAVKQQKYDYQQHVENVRHYRFRDAGQDQCFRRYVVYGFQIIYVRTYRIEGFRQRGLEENKTDYAGHKIYSVVMAGTHVQRLVFDEYYYQKHRQRIQQIPEYAEVTAFYTQQKIGSRYFPGCRRGFFQ